MEGMRKSELKREAILQAALALFAEKGFHAVSTKEIAVACGVAEGLLFYYFGDKKNLLYSIVRRFAFAETIRSELGKLDAMDPESAFVALGCSYLAFLRDNRGFLQLIWSSELIADEALSAEIQSVLSEVVEAIGNVLTPGVANGTYRLAAARQAPVLLLSSILLHAVAQQRFGDALAVSSDESFVGETVRLILRGISV